MVRHADGREIVEAGLLASAGIAAIEVAKENGSWSALDAVERLEEPTDLAAPLDADIAAREYWNSFSPSSRARESSGGS